MNCDVSNLRSKEKNASTTAQPVFTFHETASLCVVPTEYVFLNR